MRRHELFGFQSFLDAQQQIVHKAHIERQCFHDNINAVAQCFDDLVRSPPRIVVRREIPRAIGTFKNVVENFGVIVRHHCQQRGLRARRNAIVFVNDADAHRKPLAPTDANVLHTLRVHQIGWQWIAQQIADGHLRLSMLHRFAYLVQRIARENAHQHRARRFAASRSANQQTFSAHRKIQQRQQNKTRITLRGGQIQLRFGIAERERLRRRVVVFNVVMRRNHRVIHNPKICLPQFFVERDIRRRRGLKIRRGSLIQVRDIKLFLRRAARLWIRGRLGNVRERIVGHGSECNAVRNTCQSHCHANYLML